MTKQVLVVRKDLNMRKGKIAAQCAHASMKVLLDRGDTDGRGNFTFSVDEPMEEWLSGKFKKICVYVNSEEELLKVELLAKLNGLKTAMIVDSGLTEFHGVPTRTVLGIGPEFEHKFEGITSGLQLL